MMDEFVPVFDRLQNDDNVKGIVVISAKPGSFIAGADIKLDKKIFLIQFFYSFLYSECLNQLKIAMNFLKFHVMVKISCIKLNDQKNQSLLLLLDHVLVVDLKFVCFICFSYSLFVFIYQVALACHYRIAMNDKRTGFGVPEVKLGLLPGAGGTQRLVQKLSLPDALDLLLTGKELKAKKAKSLGLVDAIVEPIGPGLQEAEQKNIDYLRSIAVQKAKYVHFDQKDRYFREEN
jgi:enoyl-CoA hydratase/long-chain 3-hydroxyacyl-CoA dehydrogenase